MFEVAIESLWFVILLVISPIFLRNNWKYREWIFLGLNLFVFGVGIRSIGQLLFAAAFILLPYILTPRVKNKRWIIVALVVCFAYEMKYDWIFGVLNIPYLFAWKLLGLSYILFREIDFVMQYDWLKEEGEEIRLLDYLNYLLSFYTIICGPIMRFRDYLEDRKEEKQPLEKAEIYSQLNRMLNGYIKVFLISGVIHNYTDKAFRNFDRWSGITLLVIYLGFTFLNAWYIYFNFSGFCDIVIAAGKLAGFTIPENFNKPYLARSLSEYWNRHHITLSQWIRDYIYSPIFKWGITKFEKVDINIIQYVMLFVTFFIAGIWHGNTINYIIYGLLEGLGVSGSMWFNNTLKKKMGKKKYKEYQSKSWVKWMEIGVTWGYICISFAFVGYDTWGTLMEIFR